MAALGLRVVYNFRAKDIALGGQGAPLMPFFDEYFFGRGKPKIILNVGGVANISVVGKNVKTFGFDAGPGNALMDEFLQKRSNKNFDEGGQTAARGKIDWNILPEMLRDKYFKLRPPKSLDRNYFEKYLKLFDKKNTYDALATLNMFTAKTIALAVKKHAPAAKEIVISGGGAFNKTLLKNLADCLPGVKISPSSDYGIDVMAKESAAFALFAKLALEGKTNHCPAATGARQKTILGSVTL